MRSHRFSRLSPAVRQQLRQFAGLHRIDPGQDIGEVFDRIYVVGFARSHEGEMDRSSASASIGSDKETVLAHQHEVFDRLFGHVVVYVKTGILQESGQSNPVIESVINGRHQGMCRIELRLKGNNLLAEFLDQRLGTSAPDGQPFRRCLSFYVPFHIVEFFVYIQDDFAELGFHGQAIEVSSSRVGVASDFGSRPVSKECIEASGGVRLDAGSDVFKPGFISFERLIGRKLEDRELEFSGDVDGHFAFAHSPFELAVLDLYFRVIGVNDVGFADLACDQVVERLQSEGCLKRTVALSRTRYRCLLALKSFFLAVVRQAVAESAGDDVGAEGCSVLTASMLGFFGGDDVDFALLAGSHLLLVLQVFERVQQFIELVAQLVADEDGGDLALRANRIVFGDQMIDGLGGKFVIADVFSRGIAFLWRCCRGRRRRFSWCSLGVMALRLRAKVFAIALLELHNEDIEFFLKIFELLPELFLSGERLAQLFTEFGAAKVGFCELRFERFQEFLLLGIFPSEAIDFGIV